MLCAIPRHDLYVDNGQSYIGRFHFAYGDYSDPMNANFGVLCAVNDFEVAAGGGFSTHEHCDVEIISYCVEGQLSHIDSIGNKSTLSRGDVAYQCAGTGIMHSELNHSQRDVLRFVQILIAPRAPGLPASYHTRHFAAPHPRNTWLQIASGRAGNGSVVISQDANVRVAELDKAQRLAFTVPEDRQAYLLCLEGSVAMAGMEVEPGGAIKAKGASSGPLEALLDSHVLMVDVPEQR